MTERAELCSEPGAHLLTHEEQVVVIVVMRPLVSRTLLRSLGELWGAACSIGEDAVKVTPGSGTPYSAAGSVTGADASRKTAGAGCTYSIIGAVT